LIVFAGAAESTLEAAATVSALLFSLHLTLKTLTTLANTTAPAMSAAAAEAAAATTSS
jgi:hypothetical protein